MCTTFQLRIWKLQLHFSPIRHHRCLIGWPTIVSFKLKTQPNVDVLRHLSQSFSTEGFECSCLRVGEACNSTINGKKSPCERFRNAVSHAYLRCSKRTIGERLNRILPGSTALGSPWKKPDHATQKPDPIISNQMDNNNNNSNSNNNNNNKIITIIMIMIMIIMIMIIIINNNNKKKNNNDNKRIIMTRRKEL